MTRDQVFIANMVKCRPPDNRDPTPAEIGACSKYLDRQIELIDPRLIVTLGRFSTARFLPGQSISRVRGRLRQSNGRHVFPIMHPAAGLRRQEMRQAIEEDFAKVPGLLDVLRMEGSQPANPGHIRESTHPYLPTPPRYVPVQSSLFGDPVPPSELHEETTDRSDPVQPPSGQPPSDEPPSGQPPSDEPPSGQPPSDEPPSGQPPSGQPPSDEPPSGQPPSGQPPSDEPPSGQPPSDEPPSGQPPSDEPPSGQPPSDEPPSEPPSDEPPSEPPSGQPPSDEPPSDEPPSDEPPSDEPPSGQPPSGQPRLF